MTGGREFPNLLPGRAGSASANREAASVGPLWACPRHCSAVSGLSLGWHKMYVSNGGGKFSERNDATNPLDKEAWLRLAAD